MLKQAVLQALNAFTYLLVQKYNFLTPAKVQILTREFSSRRMLAYASVCWRMLAYAGVCWRMLANAGVCWRMLAYAGACWRMRKYACSANADVC